MRRLNREAATALLSLAALIATGHAAHATPHHPHTLFSMSEGRESVQSFMEHRDQSTRSRPPGTS